MTDLPITAHESEYFQLAVGLFFFVEVTEIPEKLLVFLFVLRLKQLFAKRSAPGQLRVLFTPLVVLKCMKMSLTPGKMVLLYLLGPKNADFNNP